MKWLIARLFARRLAQLNMPLSNRELRSGFESRIVRLGDEDGHVRHTAWVRTAMETGQPAFVGEYAQSGTRFGISHSDAQTEE
jgi:hypothetical protein